MILIVVVIRHSKHPPSSFSLLPHTTHSTHSYFKLFQEPPWEYEWEKKRWQRTQKKGARNSIVQSVALRIDDDISTRNVWLWRWWSFCRVNWVEHFPTCYVNVYRMNEFLCELVEMKPLARVMEQDEMMKSVSSALKIEKCVYESPVHFFFISFQLSDYWFTFPILLHTFTSRTSLFALSYTVHVVTFDEEDYRLRPVTHVLPSPCVLWKRRFLIQSKENIFFHPEIC